MNEIEFRILCNIFAFQGENALKEDILAQMELLSSSTRKRSSAESMTRSGPSSQESFVVGGKRPRI